MGKLIRVMYYEWEQDHAVPMKDGYLFQITEDENSIPCAWVINNDTGKIEPAKVFDVVVRLGSLGGD